MDGVLVLGAEEVAALLDPGALLEELSATFAAAARGELAAPPRGELVFDGGGLLVMPGHRPGGDGIPLPDADPWPTRRRDHADRTPATSPGRRGIPHRAPDPARVRRSSRPR